MPGDLGIQFSLAASPNVVKWVRERLAAGHPPSMIVPALVRRGFSNDVAVMLVGSCAVGVMPSALAASPPPPPPAARDSAPPAHAAMNTLDAGDRKVEVLLSMRNVGALDFALYGNVVSDDEIEHIKKSANSALRASTGQEADGSRLATSYRTSRDAWLKRRCDPVVAAVERRVSAIAGIPEIRGEDLQVLHYDPSQQFRPHWDYFHRNNQGAYADSIGVAEFGQRVGTLIVYLNDVERGGSTYFPQLDLAVHPRKGCALWFGYLHDGKLDPRTEHAGLPIITGEKWIVTKWFREKPYYPDAFPAG